jgi:hypothetical protein
MFNGEQFFNQDDKGQQWLITSEQKYNFFVHSKEAMEGWI